MLEVCFFGGFDVKYDGKSVAIPSRPAQSLLAFLLLNAGTSHRREKLAGMLWPDSLEETARDNLRHALWRVRKALEKSGSTRFLHADDVTISFKESSEYRVDTVTLASLAENAPVDELRSALGAYQGELLPGFYNEWVVLEREHLYSIFEHHMARLLSLLEKEKRWLDVLEWGERWIRLGQKPEPAYRALMSAHAAKGDMSKVASTYERCVKSLKEYGVEPSDKTQALYGRLKGGLANSETDSTVQVKEKRKGSVSPRTNLPVPLTTFIGRKKEVDEIVHLINKNRLVSLMGSGGVGKTRLAIRLAGRFLNRFKDGVWWVDLTSLNEDSLVANEVARVLDLVENPDQTVMDMLVKQLTSKQMLIVLDNCEHLVSASAQLADQLLSSCPNLKILTTSREALDLHVEMVWHVRSLTLPNVDSTEPLRKLTKFESVRLFVERVEVLQPEFRLSDQNAKSVVQICCRLGGIPLAIELAAARVKMMSVEEIARRIDDRFELLTSGSRVALPRHQTLRATIDWSHDLLTKPERTLFRRMAVFAGSFTLAAAEVICSSNGLKRSEILDLLGRLVDKSLVMVELVPLAATRYRMLETIHEYAHHKLEEAGESVLLQNRHLDYFVELTEKAEQNTFGAESVKYCRQLDQELENIRAAMDWSIETHQATMSFRLGALGAALFYFWYNRTTIGGEWQGQLNKALSSQEGKTRTAERARALNAKGFFFWADVFPENLRADVEEALSIGREIGDKSIVARSLCNLGLAESMEGNYSTARSLFEQSLQLFGEVASSNREYIWSLTFLGDVYFVQGDLQMARVHYEQSESSLREIQDRNFLAYVVRRLGQLAWYQGEYEKAARLCNESLTLNLDLADERGILASLSAYGGLATATGNHAAAARLFSAFESLLNQKNIRLVHMDRLERDRNVSLLRSQADPAILEKAWRQGTSMTLEQSIEFALKAY